MGAMNTMRVATPATGEGPSLFGSLLVILLTLAGCDEAAVAPVSSSTADAESGVDEEPAATSAAPVAVALAERATARNVSEDSFEVRFPNHGVTRHFLARVRAEPNPDAPIAGYMRRGAHFRASDRVPGVSCRRGWFEVPGSGFVCRGDAYDVGAEVTPLDAAPEAPALDDPLPYRYARARRGDLPQFWHLPSESEERAVLERVAPAETGTSEAPPGQLEEIAAPAPSQNDLPDFVRQLMRPGFYVSVDGFEEEGGRRFLRTVRGGYVRADALETLNVGTPTRGVVLGGSMRLPVAFALNDGTHRLRRVGTTRRYESAGTISRHTAVRVAELTNHNGSDYVVDDAGFTIRRSAVRVAELTPRPARVRESHRWIHISLSRQVLVAYEGDTPVYSTLVSTGREGHETPTGLFRIQSKHVSTTMDDLTDEEHAYQIEDVPWTMYFEGNYALHSAFWHDRFGHVRSHGCVNLSPADARWLFRWAGPELPASWHGVFASRERAGSWVYITE